MEINSDRCKSDNIQIISQVKYCYLVLFWSTSLSICCTTECPDVVSLSVSSDADPVDCPDSVQRFQDGLHEALQEYELSRREQHRAGRLLMSLPLLRQTADRAVRVLLRLHRQHSVPLHKLLLEMLDTKA